VRFNGLKQVFGSDNINVASVGFRLPWLEPSGSGGHPLIRVRRCQEVKVSSEWRRFDETAVKDWFGKGVSLRWEQRMRSVSRTCLGP
jgi:hypothetical protein